MSSGSSDVVVVEVVMIGSSRETGMGAVVVLMSDCEAGTGVGAEEATASLFGRCRMLVAIGAVLSSFAFVAKSL